MSAITEDNLRILLRALLEREDPRDQYRIDRDDQRAGILVPDLSGRDLLRLLERALDDHLITGERTNFGGMESWVKVFPTVLGMRFCEVWPPAGREHAPGAWQSNHWSERALPRLREIAAAETDRERCAIGLHSSSPGSEAWARLDDLRLIEAGYMAGRLLPQSTWGLGDLRITAEGERVLAGRTENAVDRARGYLLSGALRDAVIEAVEEALGERLKHLATVHGIPVINGSTEAKLANLNDQLASRGVYAKPWPKTIAAVLDQRNVYGHANDGAMTRADADWIVDCVERVLVHLPE